MDNYLLGVDSSNFDTDQGSYGFDFEENIEVLLDKVDKMVDDKMDDGDGEQEEGVVVVDFDGQIEGDPELENLIKKTKFSYRLLSRC
jgi:hypothetical protein